MNTYILRLRTISAFFIIAITLGLASCASSEAKPAPKPKDPLMVVSPTLQQKQQPAKPQKDNSWTDSILNAVGIETSDKAQEKIQQLEPYKLLLRIFTGTNLNAGQGKKAMPMVVKFYALRDTKTFKMTTFQGFLETDKNKNIFGDALIQAKEIQLLPGNSYATIRTLPADTMYLGVVAMFRTPAKHRWRFIFNVPASIASGITLGVHGCALTTSAGHLVTKLVEPPSSLAGINCPAP